MGGVQRKGRGIECAVRRVVKAPQHNLGKVRVYVLVVQGLIPRYVNFSIIVFIRIFPHAFALQFLSVCVCMRIPGSWVDNFFLCCNYSYNYHFLFLQQIAIQWLMIKLKGPGNNINCNNNNNKVYWHKIQMIKT